MTTTFVVESKSFADTQRVRNGLRVARDARDRAIKSTCATLRAGRTNPAVGHVLFVGHRG